MDLPLDTACLCCVSSSAVEQMWASPTCQEHQLLSLLMLVTLWFYGIGLRIMLCAVVYSETQHDRCIYESGWLSGITISRVVHFLHVIPSMWRRADESATDSLITAGSEASEMKMPSNSVSVFDLTVPELLSQSLLLVSFNVISNYTFWSSIGLLIQCRQSSARLIIQYPCHVK